MPSFDDKTMQKCLWCTAIDETSIFRPPDVWLSMVNIFLLLFALGIQWQSFFMSTIIIIITWMLQHYNCGMAA
jgi:hypothetical protein